MTEEGTWCLFCSNVHGATAEKDPWHWRCVKFPVRPGFGWVHPSFSPDPPYERCVKANDGNCEFYQPSRAFEQS